ncbi:hypothetical protein [Bacteroides neonati]|uniref:hypothetical protein n=1 Tax=Bacteroides neonati TaxID=1347393 RepID=UPI0004B979FD|nr:hypothetical protein [Bacteroides neonati]
MNIETLLTKYFEGETTCEEERELRQFFTSGIVPEQLEMYRPMFAFLAEENKTDKKKGAVPTAHTSVDNNRILHPRRILLYSLGGIAAGLLLLLGIAGIGYPFHEKPDSYVIIDGKQYTDAKLIHQQATAAFEEVSLNEEEVFATLFE